MLALYCSSRQTLCAFNLNFPSVASHRIAIAFHAFQLVTFLYFAFLLFLYTLITYFRFLFLSFLFIYLLALSLCPRIRKIITTVTLS